MQSDARSPATARLLLALAAMEATTPSSAAPATQHPEQCELSHTSHRLHRDPQRLTALRATAAAAPAASTSLGPDDSAPAPAATVKFTLQGRSPAPDAVEQAPAQPTVLPEGAAASSPAAPQADSAQGEAMSTDGVAGSAQVTDAGTKEEVQEPMPTKMDDVAGVDDLGTTEALSEEKGTGQDVRDPDEQALPLSTSVKEDSAEAFIGAKEEGAGLDALPSADGSSESETPFATPKLRQGSPAASDTASETVNGAATSRAYASNPAPAHARKPAPADELAHPLSTYTFANTALVPVASTSTNPFSYLTFPPEELPESWVRSKRGDDPEAYLVPDTEAGYFATAAEVEASKKREVARQARVRTKLAEINGERAATATPPPPGKGKGKGKAKTAKVGSDGPGPRRGRPPKSALRSVQPGSASAGDQLADSSNAADQDADDTGAASDGSVQVVEVAPKVVKVIHSRFNKQLALCESCD